MSERTIRRWAHRGHLHPVTLGGVTRYPRAEIEHLIAGPTGSTHDPEEARPAVGTEPGG